MDTHFISINFIIKGCYIFLSSHRKTYHELSSLEDELNNLQSECVLFDIPQPSSKLILKCKEEIK